MILNREITYQDIEGIDVQAYNSIIKIIKYGSPEKKSKLYEVLNFTCQLSNGKYVDLLPNGQNIKLTKENEDQFLELFVKARELECFDQMKALKKGLYCVIPEEIMKYLSWEDLEGRICGEPFFDIRLLKDNTVYSGYKSSSQVVKFFWRFLEECSLEDKYSYIKFVWGRNR